jgi:hypothetical protein
MNSEQLFKSVELYSNAIVGFNVLQSLAYLHAFGSNPFFNCLVKTAAHLASSLVALFLVGTALSIAATLYLGRLLGDSSTEYREVVVRIYAAKTIVVAIFGLLPAAITFPYGVLDYAGKTSCLAALQ